MPDQPTGSVSSDTKDDPEYQRLDLAAKKAEAQKRIAQAQQAVVEAQKSTLKAYLPSYESKPLEGKVTLDAKAGSLAELVAYESLKEAASKIAEKVKDVTARHCKILVVEDRSLVTSDWPYRSIKETLQQHSSALQQVGAQLDAVLPESELAEEADVADFVGLPALGAIVPSVVGAAADLVGMFRSDYAISGRDIKLASTALVAATSAELTAGKLPISVQVDGFHLLEGSQVFKGLQDVREMCNKLELKKMELEGKVAPAERYIADLRSEVEALRAAYVKALADCAAEDKANRLKASLSEARKRLKDQGEKERSVSRARALITLTETRIAAFDAFCKAITTAPDKGYPPLIAAVLREALHPAFQPTQTGDSVTKTDGRQNQDAVNQSEEQGGGSIPRDGSNEEWYILFLSIDSSGGDIITRHGLFGSSHQVGFLGQCQVSWMLLAPRTGLIVQGGTESYHRQHTYDIKAGQWK
ncbi:MAG TPA: hypothetical protein VF026_09195 [Ktedonobacteraceae bacterium]